MSDKRLELLPDVWQPSRLTDSACPLSCSSMANAADFCLGDRGISIVTAFDTEIVF